MNENSVNEVPQTSMEGNNKKNKTKFIVGGLVIVLLAVVAVIFGMKYFNKDDGKKGSMVTKLPNDPVGVYQAAVNNGFVMLKNSLSEAKNYGLSYEEPMEGTIKAKLTTTMDELKMFNNMEFSAKLGFDYKKEIINADLKLTKGSTTLDAIIGLLNNHAYFKSNALLDKVIDLGIITEEMDYPFEEVPKINYEDLEYILKAYEEPIKNAVTKDDVVEKANNKVTVEGKEYTGKEYTYTIGKNVLKRLVDEIANATLKDDKLLGILADLTETSKDEVKESFESLKETDYSEVEDVILVINTDNKSETIVSGSLTSEGKTLFTFTNVNDITIVKFEDEYSNIKFKFNENTIAFEIKEDGMTMEMSFVSKDSNGTFKMNVKEGSENVTVTADLKNAKNDDKKTSADMNLKVSGSVGGQKIDIGLEGSYTLEAKKVDSMNVTGAVKAGELTEEELNKISTNLTDIMNKLGLSDLLNGM